MITKFRKSKKGRVHSLFFSVLLGMLVVVIIGFLVFSNLKINQKRAQLNSQIESLKSQIQVLEERKRELEARISLQKSEEYLEEIAREKLNLKKPGEMVVAVTQESELEEKTPKINFFEKILEKLKFW